MLIDGGCGLRTTVAHSVVEIEGGDAMFAEGAGKGGAAVHWFRGVISHIFIVVLLAGADSGNRCATLERGNLLRGPGDTAPASGWSELNGSIADAAPDPSRKRQVFVIVCQLNKDGLATFDPVP